MEKDARQNYGQGSHNFENNPDGFDTKKSKLNEDPNYDLYMDNEGFPTYNNDPEDNAGQEGYTDDSDFGQRGVQDNPDLDDTNLDDDDLDNDPGNEEDDDDDLEEENDDIEDIEGEINSDDEINQKNKNEYYLGGSQSSYYSVYDL